MNIQPQQFDHGYLPVCRRLDLPGKRQGERAFPAYSLIHPRIALPADAPLKFRDGQMDGTKPMADVHTQNIYPNLGKSTPERVNSNQILPSQTVGMPWNLENFRKAVDDYTESKHLTQRQVAEELGLEYQSLANILSGQKALGAKKRPTATKILGWPTPDFSTPITLEINEGLLQTIIVCIEEEFGQRLSSSKKASLITRIYNLVLILPSFIAAPSKEKILDLVRSLGA